MLNAEDKIAIQELTVRYANALDSGDLAEWLDTWINDGIWEGGLGRYEGKTALAKLIADLGARIQDKRHVMCNFVISGDGNDAKQLSYLLVFERTASARLVATGVYNDVLRKIDGEWKFARRSVKLDGNFAAPT